MVQVFLRLLIWVAVISIGYLTFGPQLFDSSRGADPFASDRQLFLPPIKAQRLVELEAQLKERNLSGEEAREYQVLAQQRQSSFWSSQGVSVEEVLIGVESQRKERLIDELIKRGMSGDEIVVFLTVVERDHAALLKDRD